MLSTQSSAGDIGDRSSSFAIQSYSGAIFVEDSASEKAKGSVHSQQTWFSDMEATFMERVVGKCSQKVKNAIENNENIESLEERRAVSKEILDETLHYLHGIFGKDNPRKKNADKIAALLASAYPALFKYVEVSGQAPANAGYGLGGVKGLKELPSIICQRYHDKYLRAKRANEEAEETDDGVAGERKKGRTKLIYGVSQKKWYTAKSTKDSIEALKQAGKTAEYDAREEIFNQNRAGLMQLIRNSSNSIAKVCDGFWGDHRHLDNHFIYLTDCRISDTVETGLVGHLENMEEYLLYVNTDVEFTDKHEAVEEDCSLEFTGSLTHKYIYILRWAGDSFDTDGSDFMRIESDGPPKSPSPHVLAVKVGNGYVFELWVEGGRILGNLDLAGSVSAFLHICFTFNLKYPQKAEFLCDFLQRVVAEFGDKDGTRTSKAKSTAENKLMKYYTQLGKALGSKNVKKK